jgi:hypothetical protein
MSAPQIIKMAKRPSGSVLIYTCLCNKYFNHAELIDNNELGVFGLMSRISKLEHSMRLCFAYKNTRIADMVHYHGIPMYAVVRLLV